MERKELLHRDRLEQVKENFLSRKKEKIKRMSGCKCWNQGKFNNQKDSVVFNNEEELEGNR